MDEIVSSSPPQLPTPPPSSAAATGSITSRRNHRGTSSAAAISRVRECSSFTASLQEGIRYVKALLPGQAKEMRARNESEAAEADLQTAKMQLDAAGDSKKRIHDKSA